MGRGCLLLVGLSFLIFGLGETVAEPPVIRQEDPAPHTRAWRFFDDEDGLIGGIIRAIYQDGDGVVWFAGRKGVCRFDGLAWTVYDRETPGAPTSAYAILQAKDGAIWVASEIGVSRFDGEVWTTYTEADGLPGPMVLAICETEDGTIWAGCGKRVWMPSTPPGGLARWDGQTWRTFAQKDGLVQEHVNAIYEPPDGALWVATDGGVSRYDGRGWVSYTTADGLPHDQVLSVYQTADRSMWFGTADGIARVKDGLWTTYALEGKHQAVGSLHQTRDGTLWAYAVSALHRFEGETWHVCKIPLPGPGDFEAPRSKIYGTEGDILWLAGARVVRFDYGGTEWASYPGAVGPPYQDPEGGLWFLNASGGTVAFNEGAWQAFPQIEWPVYRSSQGTLWAGGKGGIRSSAGQAWRPHPGILDSIQIITQTRDGRLWFTGKREDRSLVACYNGGDWKTYTDEDWGKGISLGRKVVESPTGDLWFLPYLGARLLGYGLIRFDGMRWYHYTGRDVWGEDPRGDMANRVYDLEIDRTGTVWVGTGKGLWSFDGTTWKTFEGENGPAERKIVKIIAAQDSSLWYACALTKDVPGGVLRYKAGAWTAYTPADGLAGNDVWSVLEGENGTLWFGSTTGANRFDGRTWTAYKKGDGLMKDDVRYIFQDATGDIWLGLGHPYLKKHWWTTRYRRDRLPPETVLTFLPGEKLASGNLILEWSGKDPWKDTLREDLVYSWQMDDEERSTLSPETKQVFLGLEDGTHTFKVRAVDRDGNVDPTPATYTFTVLPPVWKQPWFIGMVTLFLAMTGFQASRIIVRTRERDRAREALLKEMEDELRTAHELQMSLMPKENPTVDGLDIAGRCIPTNHVGGDYFQYFTRTDNLTLVLADVTGHAMEAAIPVVMFSGILESQMELGRSVEELFERLNHSLHRTMPERTFVCFAMGELNLSTHTLRFSNGACPPPYHFQPSTGEVVELQIEAYPLGIRPDTHYPVTEIQLQPGDRLIFCSDGIIEAENPFREQYGYDRTMETVRKVCGDNLSAEETLDRILKDVDAFRGGAPQTDDMTCMVLRVEDTA